MRVLDSHLHLWDPSRLDYAWLHGPLAARYAAEELALAPVGDEPAAIFVEADAAPAQSLDEARWVDQHMVRTGVRAIVARVQLDRGAQTTAQLDALAVFGSVVGVRHLLQDAPAGTARSEAFRNGAQELAARGLRFDACVRAHQLPEVAALAAAVPELRMVLDHLGKPPIGTAQDPLAPTEDWRRGMRAVAENPRVMVKLSGLPAESAGKWSLAQVAPFLDAAAETFGGDRLLWGSDWPVSAVLQGANHAQYRARSRAAWLQTVIEWATDRGVDIDALLWRNAARFYGIP